MEPKSRTPAFVVDYLRSNGSQKKAKEQITIIARANNGRMGAMTPISMMGPGRDEASRMTGAGVDGEVQPQKYAGDVHEGEMVLSANAVQALPPDVREALSMQAEAGNIDVNALRQALKIPEKPGYWSGTGGMKLDAFKPTYDYSGPGTAKGDYSSPGSSATIPTRSDPSGQNPIMTIKDAPQEKPPVWQPGANLKPTTGTSFQLIAPPAPSPSSEQPVWNPMASSRPIPNLQPVQLVAPPPEPVKVSSIQTPPPAPPEQPVWQPGIQTKRPPAEDMVQQIVVPPPAPANTTDKAPTVDKYGQIIDTSLRRTLDTAEGRNDTERRIADSMLRRYDTAAASQTDANNMALATDRTLSDSARRSLQAQQQSGVRSGRSELIGTMAGQAADRAAQANVQAATLAAGQQAFEEDRLRYKDTEGWKSYEAAIAAGDFDTAAESYKTLTGKTISMDQMKTYQNYLNTVRGQEITSNELTLASLKNRVGDESWNSINTMITQGASLAQVNTRLAEQGKQPITMQEYQSMYDSTPLGERTWERNMSYARTLLEVGGEANIRNAAQIFNQAFPGSGIDFTNIITADKAKTFNTGMAQLSDYVAAGMDYEEAIIAMRNNGTLTMLGVPEDDVEKLYRGLKVNAIDEQWKEISGSEWYKGLDAESKKDMSDFFTAVLSGKLDYSVKKEYTYTDASGNTVSKLFNTEKEAADFAAQNKVTLTATGKTQVVPRATTGAGGDDGFNGGPPPAVDVSKLQQGELTLVGGKVYEKGADGQPKEVTMPTDVWGDAADKILAKGRDGNPYFDQINAARIAQIKEDPASVDLSKVINLDPASDVYKAALTYVPIGRYQVNSDGTGLREPPDPGTTVKIKRPDGGYTFATVEWNKGAFAQLRTKDNRIYQIIVRRGPFRSGYDVVGIAEIRDGKAGNYNEYKQSDWA